MPIKNYTTVVDVHKTCGEISGLLAAKGARSIQTEYDESREPCGLSFVLPVQKLAVRFRLPCNIPGVLKCLQEQPKIEAQYRKETHARKVAWRILKTWIEAQMAIIEAGIAQLEEVFLPYAIIGENRTAFQQFQESAQRQLTKGNTDESS